MKEAEKGRKRRRGQRTEWWGKESREKDEGDQEIIIHETFPLYLLHARHCSKCLMYITPMNPYKSPWVRDSHYVNFTDWSIKVQRSQVTYSRGTMSQKLNSFPAAPESRLFVTAPRCLSEKWNMEKTSSSSVVLPEDENFLSCACSFMAPMVLNWKSRLTGLPPAKLLPCRQKCIFHLCNRICHRKLLPAS